ncbi:MAG: hypothetical protein A2Y04_04100 [Omnitrophica WOR_2 bacterium GWC2_45_7]|nr:MAG: hypothetical protein A2Y04_04100 [Omnitrophica WOR_2 bacterium GWC2_45_7]
MLVVHFPIALFFTAPLFIVLGLTFERLSKAFYAASLLLMGLGMLTLFLSISTGEAASETLNLLPDALETLEAHDRLNLQCRFVFSILTGIWAVYVLSFSRLNKVFSRKIHIVILLSFLLIYSYGLLILLSAAHQGGKLVHHHGIKSKLFDRPALSVTPQ